MCCFKLPNLESFVTVAIVAICLTDTGLEGCIF